MSISRDLGDILDRFSIASLKEQRIGTEENKKEVIAFKEMLKEIKIKYPQYDIDQWFHMMYMINDYIWFLEAGLKSGKEELANPTYILDRRNISALANIGATTLLIRNFNSLRVQFKNIINKVVGEGFQDIKKDHCSEERHI